MIAHESLRMKCSVVFVLFLASMIPVQVSSQGSEGQQTTYICEKESGTIQCTEPSMINIISASYGSRDYANHCDGFCIGLFVSCDCSSDVTGPVQELCNGKYTCQVNSSNDVFEDPCPIRPKLLLLTYSCDYVASTSVLTTAERTAQPSTTTATVTKDPEVPFTTGELSKTKTTGSIVRPQTTANTTLQTTLKTTGQGFTHEDISTSGTTMEVTTTLMGNSGALDSYGSPGGTVILASVVASVVAFILVLGVAGFILWKRRKRPDSTGSPTSVTNDIHVYDDVITSSNIQLTNTGATYRTDGNCNPSETNIADLYAKPNKKKSAPNADQLYAKPVKKKSNVSNVDEMYAKPHKATGASKIPCDNELDNEDEGSVDNMLYESTGNITFTTQYTADNDEGYVDNELYGSTA